ncbi:MAG: linear amide C-N hydrolase [Ignavibacteriales bacterium]|nr:linear amide C-N hydrolase [Ignavibacteriales bacterium]
MNHPVVSYTPRRSSGAAFVVLLIALVVNSCQDTGPVSSSSANDEKTLKSLTKANGHPLYTMKYYGDYGFAQQVGLAKGQPVALDNSLSADDSAWGCTCFVAYGTSGNPQFGRNFDWHDCIPLLLFTHPPAGYASVSMVDLEYLGYTRSNLPDGGTDKAALLRTPWYPFDGMNEKGVTVGMMAVPTARAPYDPTKISLGELGTIRLILDFAATTDEAIALLGKYNLRMEDPPIHYLIADAAGHSAVIEYVNGTMSVLKNTEPWHVSTNFIVTGSGAPALSPCWRYSTAYSELTAAGGKMTCDAALALLGKVSQSTTIWSVVYEMGNGTVHVATDRTYDGALKFVLKENLPVR